MALCSPFFVSNNGPVTSLSSTFLPGTTLSSFSIDRKPRTFNLKNVSVSICRSSLKIVRDRTLDRHVIMKNRIRFVQKLKTLLLSKPKHYLPIHILSKCRAYLSLHKPRSLLAMIHRYPSIFEPFTIPWPPTPLNATKLYPQLCVRLTPAAATLAAEELSLQSSISTILANKLHKLLMLSSYHRLLLSKLVHLAPDLGLPSNFRSRLCNDHPNKFKVVDTSYGCALELVSWDSDLAKPLPPPVFQSLDLIVDRPLKFKQLRLRKGLNLKRTHQDFLLKFEEVPEVCPYTNPAESFAKESIEAEKRCCAVIREVLGMTIEKRSLIDHLTHFRKEFGLPNKLRRMIVRHPELFYTSMKGQRDSVFLVEGFDEKGDLLEKDEILSLQDKWMDLARESKRMRRDRRKVRMDKGIGSLSDVNQNHDDSDIDYDDDIGMDNFEDGYDDGFEDIFEDLDFEAEDYDHENNLFANKIGEFWTAGPFPIQNGLDGEQKQPW
ncbi:protein WHAT'S THIS FACTOR 1, chloroplastic [Cicer arietinum]|uniref:Protein WHAT'S THIS FACTOR 1, chloroplastic n=1 Tax=Cicer arietinum TaxID=3827 RepID=A0A1S3E7K0_CICAR|nr:protein WHAT'S THIS FACTOR 1, chloroplastic [Cicer arietinum]XP_012571797.1 protein WHAT'S THIS FACTOR 1, chloroplastic [Cicer arietinum]XP_012571798.1 protein WHAT'S THIS FACTOR 1, chloroplastic [Cicer arietinum]XP_012571799.1 protein WHAT'S THIS FACTOR 1, chloroplastic [Cicer arietinum]XP_027190829.1 protein WHAT'S THIS FACTOR 1, chloroplastic [Cicer arietinum]XP_027190830.1 protein WHAT'S THIS FACTOR 1, chloroplastic [Cicer arietinum]XP_027190831.1 protein WHAT'S THIS FACTOR 1, chloropl